MCRFKKAGSDSFRIEVVSTFRFTGYHGGVTGLTCGGDSGSPLVFFNSEEGHYVQVGIASGGTCQSKSDPSIFARIEDGETLDFIRQQFGDHIPPTSVQAIEKLIIKSYDELKERFLKLEKKVSDLTDKNTALISKIVRIF